MMESGILKGRNIVFDMMKGVAIIAVIVGHLDNCADVNDYFIYKVVHKIIYSFHMPLFFIVSGFFFKKKSFWIDLRRLFVPYVFVCFVCILFMIIEAFGTQLDQNEKLCRFVERALWGSGGYSEAPLFGKVPDFLPIWFLPALLWCKQVFTLVHKYCNGLLKKGIACLLISIAFTYIDRNLIYIPFSFNQGLSAIIFYYIGYAVRSYGLDTLSNLSKWFGYAAIVIILINLPIGTILLAGCKYQCYPLNLLGATCSTWLIYYLCKKYIIKVSLFSSFLSWTGSLSLLVLCVHSILIELRLFYPLPSYPILVLLASVIYCIILVWVLSKIGLIRYLFQIK